MDAQLCQWKRNVRPTSRASTSDPFVLVGNPAALPRNGKGIRSIVGEILYHNYTESILHHEEKVNLMASQVCQTFCIKGPWE